MIYSCSTCSDSDEAKYSDKGIVPWRRWRAGMGAAGRPGGWKRQQCVAEMLERCCRTKVIRTALKRAALPWIAPSSSLNWTGTTPVATCKMFCSSAWRIGQTPTVDDIEFSRRIASTPAANLCSADVSRAASVASQILRLPPSPDAGNPEDNHPPDPWAVPLGQLLRGLVAYPSWLIPVPAPDDNAIQTLLTNDDKPLVVACADTEFLQAAPAPDNDSSTERSYRTLSGSGLVFQWHQSQSAAEDADDGREGLAGIVFNPSANQSDFSFTELVLPHLMGIAAAQTAEDACRQLQSWINLPSSQADSGPPEKAMQLLSRFPFTALLHIDDTGQQRLHSSENGDSVVVTAVDLAAKLSSLVLEAQNQQALGGEWRVVQLPLRAVIEASLAQSDGATGIEIVFAWAPVEQWADAEVLKLRLPTAEMAIKLFKDAGVDVLQS